MSQTTDTIIDEERVSWLAIAAEETLDPGLKKLFAKAREKLGFVPNVFVAYMTRPNHFSPWFNHFRELMQGESELTVAEREMICLTVSSINGCLYCLVAHGAELRQLLNDPVLGDRITLDYRRAGLDERTTAMLDYAAKITRTPVDCSEADVEALRQHGFSDETIFDIAEIAAMFNFTNRLASAIGDDAQSGVSRAGALSLYHDIPYLGECRFSLFHRQTQSASPELSKAIFGTSSEAKI